MTPKEKAFHLYYKYIREIIADNEKAKKCAFIAVNEIIKSKELDYLFTKEQIYSMEYTSDDRWIYENFMKYWKQVKKEIKKL